jgi:hypothetical protein
MIEFVEEELTIKVTETISWENTVRWIYDRVMEDMMSTAEYEEDEELVQKYKELESDKISHKDKVEIMDLIGEEMSWNGNFYDDERVEDIIWDWITERSKD